MPLPPAFEERPFGVQLVGAIVVPVIFGLLSGFALGWSELLYLLMVGPIGIAGGFLGGIEHRGAQEGFTRGLIGGLVYGSFILLGLEILNDEPEAYLGEPQAGLVFVTTIVGAILGSLGGAYRVRRERAAGPEAGARVAGG